MGRSAVVYVGGGLYRSGDGGDTEGGLLVRVLGKSGGVGKELKKGVMEGMIQPLFICSVCLALPTLHCTLKEISGRSLHLQPTCRWTSFYIYN